MFAAGVAVALALVVFRLASEPAAPAEPSRQPPAEAATTRGTVEPGAAPAAREASGALAAAPDEPDDDSGRAGGEPSDVDGSTADSVAAELKRMSAGYRNRVFLHAIRERGHYCSDVLDTQLGHDDIAAWRVACTGTDVFLISVAASGELVIEPLYYGDHLGLGPPRTPVTPQPQQQPFVVPVEPE